MKKPVIVLSSFFLIFQALPASAEPLSANDGATICNQIVGNTANVVAYRLSVASGGDCVVEFRNVGSTTWTAPSSVSQVQVLVVAGGGSGGRATNSGGAGGGGAGGVVTHSNFSVSGTLNVTVGAGGASQTSYKRGNNGGQSNFSTLIAPGGGGGGLWCHINCADAVDNNKSLSKRQVYGIPGGSGGGSGGGLEDSFGGAVIIPTLPAGATFYGNVGGDAVLGSPFGGTGGGGAGGPSLSRTTAANPATAGGPGTANSITGTSTFYAGGGGGSGGNGDAGANGGSGIGGVGSIGDGYNTPVATSGKALTGSGGGGANGNNNGKSSGAGGSGVIIIRYSPITDQTLTLSSLGTSSKTYPYSQALTMSTTGSSGSGAITYSATNGTATGCLLSNSSNTATLSASTSGTCLITATIASDTNYNAATSSAASFTFSRAPQSPIIITSISASFGSELALTSSGGSTGGAYIYTYLSGDCTISGETLTPTSSGFCTIQSTLGSTTNYLAETSTATTITIAASSVSASITLDAANLIYRQVKVITATATVTGKVTFKVNGKRLAGCISKSVSSSNSYIARCSYKPSTRGYIRISATLNPANASYIGTTTTFERLFVGNRSGPR